MDRPDFVPDLNELEAALRDRAFPDVSRSFRGRVLAAVRHELAARRPASGGWGWYGAGVAAAVLLGLNLSLSAVNDTDFFRRTAPRRASTAALADRIQEALPELTAEEAQTWALLYGAGGRFDAPAPLVSVPVRHANTDF